MSISSATSSSNPSPTSNDCVSALNPAPSRPVLLPLLPSRRRGPGRGGPHSRKDERRFSLSSRAKPCPHLFVLMYHYLIVPQPLMYFIEGCLNQMRPPFVLHRLNPPTGPATNSLAPNCPINVSTSVCA